MQFSLIVTLALLLPVLAKAANVAADESFHIDTITCWDISTIDEADRVAAVMLVYGYVAGVHGLEEQQNANIEKAVEGVSKLCASNPDMYVVSAFQRYIPDADHRGSNR